ncbi:MAG: DUF1820 family protein [Pseudomonadota bacterium]
MSEEDSIYKVQFLNQGEVFEVYVKNIYSSDLYGFVEIEDYVFGKSTQVVIDPGEDKLRSEFDGVQRSFIPMHAVIRIDEVEREGQAKIKESRGDKVTPFPLLMPKGPNPQGSGSS